MIWTSISWTQCSEIAFFVSSEKSLPRSGLVRNTFLSSQSVFTGKSPSSETSSSLTSIMTASRAAAWSARSFKSVWVFNLGPHLPTPIRAVVFAIILCRASGSCGLSMRGARQSFSFNSSSPLSDSFAVVSAFGTLPAAASRISCSCFFLFSLTEASAFTSATPESPGISFFVLGADVRSSFPA